MEVKHVNQETKNSWKQASTNYHKLLDYVHRRGSLSYIVYMSKVINNKNLSEDLKTIDVHFHSLKNIEVARLELAIEKIKKFYDAGEVTNDYNKLVDAITKSNKVSNISLDQKEILQKAISNYAKKLGLLMTEYDAVIESVRKYPTMAELEASKEAKQITLADTNNELTQEEKNQLAQNSSINNVIKEEGTKAEKKEDYNQFIILAIVALIAFLIYKYF